MTQLYKLYFSLSVIEVLSECRLLSYMAQVENRLSFLFRLINIINVQTLTQARLYFVHFHNLPEVTRKDFGTEGIFVEKRDFQNLLWSIWWPITLLTLYITVIQAFKKKMYVFVVRSQENVSCLNTSLVVLMLARWRGKLPFYLRALKEKEYAEKYPGCLLNNFHHLLRFWQHHYLNKDKDSTCLENVS